MRPDPKPFYEHNLLALQAKGKILQRKKNLFGIVRFGNIAVVLALVYFLSFLGWVTVVLWVIAMLLLFRWLILQDIANKAAIAKIEDLVQINKDETGALAGRYFHFNDGKEYTPSTHAYSHDLDITGHASVYQWCNRTVSWMGSSRLAGWLLTPASTTDILERQQAVIELAHKRELGQLLQASGRRNPVQEKTYRRLLIWSTEKPVLSQVKPWRWLRIIVPVIMSLVTLLVVFGLLPLTALYPFLFVSAILAYQLNKVIAPIHEKLSKMVAELDTLAEGIALVEEQKFKSEFLSALQLTFKNTDQKASKKIKDLKAILDRLDLRYNIVLSAPLNLLFLWNLQQVLALEKWKKEHAADVEAWFTKLGDVEAINSFATIYFNNPEWIMPDVSEQGFQVKMKNAGHPLILEEKRVVNDVHLDKSGELMIVTGSNMAGKSTYLRSIGVNVVLAMAGAPVCATHCELARVQLLSSMRVSDNLEENTSTFYAELKKLKSIIDKVNAKEDVFILLDEILRGTNSLDRHTGSVALIKQFIKHKAAGIIATHDVKLADLIQDYPENIINTHFDATVEGDELYFDYKLKAGISKSLNASILMKKIGIEL